jgi:hypothetical protein
LCALTTLKAKADAERIYQAGEKKMISDQSVFVDVLSNISFQQVVATCDAYPAISKKKWSLEKAVTKKTGGTVKHALICILQVAQDPTNFWTIRLNKSLNGTVLVSCGWWGGGGGGSSFDGSAWILQPGLNASMSVCSNSSASPQGLGVSYKCHLSVPFSTHCRQVGRDARPIVDPDHRVPGRNRFANHRSTLRFFVRQAFARRHWIRLEPAVLKDAAFYHRR